MSEVMEWPKVYKDRINLIRRRKSCNWMEATNLYQAYLYRGEGENPFPPELQIPMEAYGKWKQEELGIPPKEINVDVKVGEETVPWDHVTSARWFIRKCGSIEAARKAFEAGMKLFALSPK